MPAPALLIAQHITVARGDRSLLEDFSLQLNAGQIVHLTGRNGAGKTSLLEVLANLRQPQQGSVIRPEHWHWVGHKNGLHPALSATQNLEFWCGLNHISPAGITPALNALRLAPRSRPVRSLSTGQKRRTALAQLLLQPRPLWLLDEPLAGLDTDGVALLAQLLAEHRAGGGAALFTSHQPLALQDVQQLHLA